MIKYQSLEHRRSSHLQDKKKSYEFQHLLAFAETSYQIRQKNFISQNRNTYTQRYTKRIIQRNEIFIGDSMTFNNLHPKTTWC